MEFLIPFSELGGNVAREGDDIVVTPFLPRHARGLRDCVCTSCSTGVLQVPRHCACERGPLIVDNDRECARCGGRPDSLSARIAAKAAARAIQLHHAAA